MHDRTTIAGALSAMTFAMGRRFVIADGVERWKEAEVEPVAQALASADPETLTVAFFAREEGRYKAPAEAPRGGREGRRPDRRRDERQGRDLPKWLAEQAKDSSTCDIDRDGAKALVAQVGERQQRLLRELEKLALEHGPGATIGAEEVEESCATSAERKVWTLADALVAGDRKTSLAPAAGAAPAGRAGHRPDLQHGPPPARRGRRSPRRCRQGQSPAQVKKRCGCPRAPRTSSSRTSQNRDVEALRRALAAMADLEVADAAAASSSEDTEAVRAVLIATR